MNTPQMTDTTLPRKQRVRTASRQRARQRCREYIVEVKAQNPCVCGEADPAALDFHHRDPANKDFTVSYLLKGRSISRIKAEIAKCICICSNCHRKGHAGNPHPDHAPYFAALIPCHPADMKPRIPRLLPCSPALSDQRSMATAGTGQNPVAGRLEAIAKSSL